MPSLTYFQTALVGNRTAKIDFSKSSECRECAKSLLEPGDKSKALALLALTSREPDAASELRQLIDVDILEELLPEYRTAVLRLMASLGTVPTTRVLNAITELVNIDKPSIDDINAAQFAAQLLKENGLHVPCSLNPRSQPLYLAAQISAAQEQKIDPDLLLKCMKSPNKNLRLASARKLAQMDRQFSYNVLPFIVELIPDSEASEVAALVVSNNPFGAQELFQHSNFKQLLSDPANISPQVLQLCAAAAQTDELRLALIKQGAISVVMKRKDPDALKLLLTLTRSVRCLRCGVASSEVAQFLFACLEGDLEVKAAALAVACNLVIDTSPISDLILDRVRDTAVEGISSTHRQMQLSSIWFLKNASYNKNISTFKEDVMCGLGVRKLLKLCDCGDLEVEDAALGFLRNYLAYNDAGIDLWLSMCPIDLWSLVERKLRAAQLVVNTLYILVHIAASTEAHKRAILERPNLLNRVASVLESTEDEQVLIAGVWFLCNLYQKGDVNSSSLELFKNPLKKCLKYHITIRVKAESLLQTVGSI